MTRRTEEQNERRERPKVRPHSDGKRRKPRGPLFRSGDPTLARRLEREVYGPGR